MLCKHLIYLLGLSPISAQSSRAPLHELWLQDSAAGGAYRTSCTKACIQAFELLPAPALLYLSGLLPLQASALHRAGGSAVLNLIVYMSFLSIEVMSVTFLPVRNWLCPAPQTSAPVKHLQSLAFTPTWHKGIYSLAPWFVSLRFLNEVIFIHVYWPFVFTCGNTFLIPSFCLLLVPAHLGWGGVASVNVKYVKWRE